MEVLKDGVVIGRMYVSDDADVPLQTQTLRDITPAHLTDVPGMGVNARGPRLPSAVRSGDDSP
jgi:hypothetical protein